MFILARDVQSIENKIRNKYQVNPYIYLDNKISYGGLCLPKFCSLGFIKCLRIHIVFKEQIDGIGFEIKNLWTSSIALSILLLRTDGLIDV